MLGYHRHIGDIKEHRAMKIIIFGASGMVGQGVLRECLLAEDVEQVTTVGRSSLKETHPKLRQLVLPDLLQPETLDEAEWQGFDACFFCLGISSSGLSEVQYRRQTYDLTMGIAKKLAQHSPNLTFTYVSGTGTDSSEKGRVMWARVKGKTENDLQKLPLASVYLFRPGLIVPLHGIESKTASYRVFYRWSKPVLALFRQLFPQRLVTTESLGRAMLNAARGAKGRFIIEAKQINALAKAPR